MTYSLHRMRRGFTLVEMLMVIVILGILGAMVAVFMRRPVDAFFDTARRAALSDVADTVVRRMARDIRKALPNSLRTPTNQCIEFIPTRTGGRYRGAINAAGMGDILNFAVADVSFDMLGLNAAAGDQQIVPGDLIAVYNLGIAGANAYAGDNTSVVTAVAAGSLPGETNIRINARLFPFASPAGRFQVIPGNEQIVSYVCRGSNLFRNTNYGLANSCPAVGGNLMARNVTCNFVYIGDDLQRNGMVQIMLQIASGVEAVNLYHEVNVNNTP